MQGARPDDDVMIGRHQRAQMAMPQGAPARLVRHVDGALLCNTEQTGKAAPS